MARNEEKAQSMLNRWWQTKSDADRPKRKRPYLASMCHNVVSCERWRMTILREIGKKVTEVQNASLGAHKLRELNDEINKLIREKGHWERRILELGGPNYLHSMPEISGDSGKEVEFGGPSYKYFGAVRELPGVRDLFHQPAEQKDKTRGELFKSVDADYYGFRDEEDGLLEPLEREAEKEARAKALEEWNKTHGESEAVTGDHMEFDQDLTPSNVFVVPSKEDIENMLLERRRAEMMAMFT